MSTTQGPQASKSCLSVALPGETPFLSASLTMVEQPGIAGLDGKLIGHLAPEGVNFAAGQVGGLARLGGVQRRAHQHGHAADGRAFQPRRLQHGAQVGEFHGGGAAAQQVVKRQHAVGLAAAKGGLELDDRLAVLPADAAQRLHQQPLHALGDIGAGKELHRVAVLIGALAARHLRKVGGELGVFVAPLRHVRVRLDDLAPAGQAADGRRLHHACGGFRLARALPGGHGAFRGRARGAVDVLAVDGANGAFGLRIHLPGKLGNGVQIAGGVLVGNVLAADVGDVVADLAYQHRPGVRLAAHEHLEAVFPVAQEHVAAGGDVQRVRALAKVRQLAEAVLLVLKAGGKGHDRLLPPELVVFLIIGDALAYLPAEPGGHRIPQNGERLRDLFRVLHGEPSSNVHLRLLRLHAAQFRGAGLYVRPGDHQVVVGGALLRPLLALADGVKPIGQRLGVFGAVAGKPCDDGGAGLHAARFHGAGKLLGQEPHALFADAYGLGRLLARQQTHLPLGGGEHAAVGERLHAGVSWRGRVCPRRRT